MGCYTSKFEKVKLTEPYPACLSYLSDDSSLCSYTKPTAGKTFVHRLGAYLLSLDHLQDTLPMGHCFLSVTSRDFPAISAVTGHDFLAVSVVTGWDFLAVTFSVWGNVKNSVGGRNRSQY
jgi:hypothetical protein